MERKYMHKQFVERFKSKGNEHNRKKRLTFAKEYLKKDPGWWNDVISVNENKFSGFGSDGGQKIWRAKMRSYITLYYLKKNPEANRN